VNRFDRAAELLEQLLELPEDQHDSALEEEPDGEVRALAREMLAGEERVEPLLDRGLDGVGALVGKAWRDAASGTPQASPTLEIDGERYRVLEELARGGMGVVFRGRDREIGRDVAIKVLRENHAEGSAAHLRFVEEAQIAGQLQHPGVVPVYELGKDEAGRPFFAMKLVEGQTLGALLAGRPDLEADRARLVSIFLQVCQTLAFAHARGVIHRDLKPSNVMVGAFGEVQVLDWGIAKVLGGASEPGTDGQAPARTQPLETVRTRALSDTGSGSASVSGSVMGTPRYMPPEQARGEIEVLDRRADVFTLGAILCEILTGEPPFPGDHRVSLRRARAAELGPARARLESCGADPALIALALRALAGDPQDRQADAGELAREVSASLDALEQRARAAERAAEAARATVAVERRARRRTVVLGSTGALLFVLLVAVSAWRVVERDRRVLELTGEVSAALDLAEARRDGARASPVDASAPWEAAALALEAAERIHASGETSPEVSARLATLRAELSRSAAEAEAERARHARDRAMVARLEVIRAPTGDGADPWNYELMDREYRRAFAEYGIPIDADRPTEELRGLLAGSAVARELGLALDQWALTNLVRGQGTVADIEAFSNRLLELAGAADPDPARARIRRALVQEDQEAMRALARDTSDLPAESVLLLGGGLRARGDLPATIAVLRAGVSRHRGDFWLSLLFGIVLRARDGAASNAAIPHFHAALGARPESREARHLLGENLTKLGRIDEAERMFEELCELDPGSGHYLAHLGRIAGERGDLEGERRLYEEALELEPDDANVLNWLGGNLLDRRMGWLAVAPLTRACELRDNEQDENLLGNALAEAGEIEAAFEHYRALDERGPPHPEVLYHVALFSDEVGRPELAEPALRRAIELRPSFAQAHCNLGQQMIEQGRYEEAVVAYRRGHQLGAITPRWSYPSQEWIERAELLVILDGELDLYLEDGIDPTDTRMAVELAGIAATRGWTVRASEWYGALLEHAPDYPDRLIDVGDAGAVAARAAAGEGEDAGALSLAERANLALLSLTWLDEVLDRLETDARADPVGELESTRSWLLALRKDRRLDALRGDAAAALGPEVARTAAALWERIDRIDAEIVSSLPAR
jgi:serine/threonine-protein kinase